MKPKEEGISKNTLGAFKIIGTIVSFFGGTAAIFLAFGYITILSCLSSVRLYGLVNYGSQFYKEVFISFLHDIASFFSGHLFLTLIALFIACSTLIYPRLLKKKIPQLLKKEKAPSWLIYSVSIFVMLFSIVVVFLTYTLDYFENKPLTHAFSKGHTFYLLSLPVLIAMAIYLVENYKRINLENPQKNFVVAIFAIFIILFISIPIGYGTYLYKIPVFASEPPELVDGVQLKAFEDEQQVLSYQDTPSVSENDEVGAPSDKDIQNSRDSDSGDKYDYFCILGQVADKQIYINLKKPEKIRIIIIDKSLIESSRINYSIEMDLREALSRKTSKEQETYNTGIFQEIR